MVVLLLQLKKLIDLVLRCSLVVHVECRAVISSTFY